MTDEIIKPPVIFPRGAEKSEARIIEEEEDEHEGDDRGRPAHEPTDATKTAVMLLSAFGVSQKKIAQYIGLNTDKTLRRHYRDEIDKSETMVDAIAIGAWMKNLQEGKEMTVLRYMERKFLKPDAPPIPPSPETVEVTKERVRAIVKQIREEY